VPNKAYNGHAQQKLVTPCMQTVRGNEEKKQKVAQETELVYICTSSPMKATFKI